MKDLTSKLRSAAALRLMIILVWGVACFAYFQLALPNRFFYQEQNQLFLLTLDYAFSYMQKPAWLACLAGDFLTQFYYYLYAGAAILAVVLLTLGDLSRRAFEQLPWIKGMRKAKASNWTAFVLALLLMTIEAARCLNHDYRQASTIALTGGMGMAWIRGWVVSWCLARCQSGTWKEAVALFIIDLTTLLLCYWMFGYGWWAILAYILIFDFKLIVDRNKQSIRPPHILASIIASIALTYVAAVCSANYYLLTLDQLLVYPGLGQLGKPRMDVEQALAAENAYYFGQDLKVIQLAQQTPREELTTQLTYYYNLASARQGVLADNLLRVQPTELGTFQRIGPGTSTMVLHSIHDMYYLWGDMTFAERAATLGLVSSHQNRNVRMVKRLAEVSIVRNDWEAATKYLRILSHTMVYRPWAERLMQQEPKHMKQYIDKRDYQNTQQTIRINDNAHYILDDLLASNPKNEVALHYMLCADLLLKDLGTFKADYDRWCFNRKAPRPEAIYQQALMIWLAANQAPEEEWRQYIIRTDLMPRWQQYNQQRGNPAFADTYWYYFDKAKTPEYKQ